jgi:hypothetical protein
VLAGVDNHILTFKQLPDKEIDVEGEMGRILVSLNRKVPVRTPAF